MSLFRYFHRLPLLLRVVSIMGVLLPLASVAVLVPLFVLGWMAYPPAPAVPGGYFRLWWIGMNGIALALPCLFVVNLYCLRFVEPPRRAFAVSSWQRQVGVFGLLAALPLGGIAVALILPSVLPTSILEMGIAALGGILYSGLQMAIIGTALTNTPSSAPMHAPGSW
jgi:hypothetical protein